MKHEHLWELVPKPCRCGKLPKKKKAFWMEFDPTMAYTPYTVKFSKRGKRGNKS
jgi:hypothetical protein